MSFDQHFCCRRTDPNAFLVGKTEEIHLTQCTCEVCSVKKVEWWRCDSSINLTLWTFYTNQFDSVLRQPSKIEEQTLQKDLFLVSLKEASLLLGCVHLFCLEDARYVTKWLNSFSSANWNGNWDWEWEMGMGVGNRWEGKIVQKFCRGREKTS